MHHKNGWLIRQARQQARKLKRQIRHSGQKTMMDWEQDGMKLNIEPETGKSSKIPTKPLYYYAEEEGLWKCLYIKVLFN